MDQPAEEAAIIVEIGNEISPPSAKRVRRCVQSKLFWQKPQVDEAKALVIEEEKEKCEEIEREGRKGKSQVKTPKKDFKSSQSKLPWHVPRGEEGKVKVIEEEREEPQGSEEEEKKGKKMKSKARTPQKSPANKKEAQRSSARNKSNKNCQQLTYEQTGEDTPKTPPTSRGSAHGRSNSKKSINNKRSDAAKDVDGQNMNIHCPSTDLWLEAKLAAEENLRLSAGKQTHPFFTSRKTAKRLPETQEIRKMEMRFWPGLDGDYTVSCPPIHVSDTLEDGIASFDWKSWVFTETSLSDLNGYRAVEKVSSVFDDSVKPLLLDNLCHEGMHHNQLSDKVDVQPLSMASDKLTSIDGQKLDVQACLSSTTSLSPGTFYSVDNLEDKQQDGLLTERLTSYYQHISCWPECSLWTNKYQPENALEVCGNSESVRILTEWLKSWNERVLQSSKKKKISEHYATEESEDSTYEIESDMDDEETLKNVLLITGPVGSGKSAAIYACAKEQGFEVIEINTSDVRHGAHMKQKFGQAMDSHALNEWSVEDPTVCRRKDISDLLSSPVDIGEDEEHGNGSVEMTSRSCKQDATQAKSSPEKISINQAANKTLILFEDVDIVFDEDRGFIASILQLAETAKRPIILTSNYRKPVLPQLLDRFVLEFTPPSSEELLSHLYMICASEKAHVSSDVLDRLVRSCLGDIRKTLMLLQFWCQGRELQIDRNTESSYSLLALDVDAAYSVIPILIPWELQCKLSEKVGEDIDKTIAMVEENLQWTEATPQVLSSMEMVNIPKHDDVTTPVKPRKRALFKRNPSFIDFTEMLNHANDLEDLSDASDCPETNTKRRVKHRHGIILSSQSDDGSADEHPCIDIMNDHQIPDSSTAFIPQTTEVLNLLDLSDDLICRLKGHDTVERPLENFEIASVSHICDTYKLQDVSCVPESSFISGTETNREDGFLAISSQNMSLNLADSIRTVDVLPEDTNNSYRTIIELGNCLEDNAVNTCDIDVESVNGNEERGDSQNEDASLCYGYQLMDECSRADFSMQLLTGTTSECSVEVDLVQETWRKMRSAHDDLKSYLPDTRKDVYLIVNHVSGMADLISEADIMFRSCYPLVNDILEPSMVPTVEPDVCSCYEEQMEMGSTYSQHGLCFYTSKFAEVGSNLGHRSRMDLAQELLSSSKNTMALGKLLSKGKSTCKNSHLEERLHVEKTRCSIPTGREMEPKLCDAILSTVPARLSMVLRDSAFHEYVSFLSKLSRLGCSRLSQSTERRKRSRASRHYLSSGPLSLSDEHVQLLARTGCFNSQE